MPTLSNNTYLSSPLTLKHVQKEGQFCGYASLFENTDSQGDRVLKGAFQESLRKNASPKMLWQHDVKEPIGQWHLIQEDDKGLYVEGQLLLDLQKGREAYSLLKKGILDGLSIGCAIKESNYSEEDGARELKEVDLLEISLVTFPANEEAKITAVKGDKQKVSSIIKDIQQAIKILKS